MPYILPEKRKPIDPLVDELAQHLTCGGDYNYAFTRLMLHYIKEEKNYARVAEMVTSLECCKLEFYRRHAAEYEDQKCAQNGDVKI